MPSPHPIGYTPRIARRRVSVTAGDISQAQASNSKNCAIARAVASSVSGASHIMVDVASIRFSHDNGTKRSYYLTPAQVQRFIIAFDLGEPVEPFTFELREGTVHDVARRPGVGGRPKGTRVASDTRAPKVVNRGRRTYGARSMTPEPIAAKRAKSHA